MSRSGPADPLYRHTQRGSVILWALGLGALFITAILVLLAREGPALVILPGAVLVLLGAIAALFGTLTVEVRADAVLASFGAGLIRKELRAEDIRSAEPVRNRWYYGWGIRLTPQGWLFNVSGLDAVEVRLRDGRAFRIGTDEPERLAAAIRLACGGSQPSA